MSFKADNSLINIKGNHLNLLNISINPLIMSIDFFFFYYQTLAVNATIKLFPILHKSA